MQETILRFTYRAALLLGVAFVAAACSTAGGRNIPAFDTATPSPQAPSLESAATTPTTAYALATFIEFPPFPYSHRTAPPVAAAIDGLYSRIVPYEGTPTPCKRCAGYRIEGGLWTLYLDRGVFKVFHPATGFASVGSFLVAGDHVSLFNDPVCEEDLGMVGEYTWSKEGSALVLHSIDDLCSIHLRARNLTAMPWREQKTDPCLPPNREAAVTDHWAVPVGCR